MYLIQFPLWPDEERGEPPGGLLLSPPSSGSHAAACPSWARVSFYLCYEMMFF
jgi:hypothetical protein